MIETKYYLKSNVISQPLVNQWYSWSFLVVPQTAAMLITFSHLNIMRSYLANPALHEEAMTQPLLKGGPFINFKKRNIEFIQELLIDTENNCNLLITLANSIKDIFIILENYENGDHLAPLYDEIPNALRGYIELVYDLQNQKSFRFIEPLLYKSKYSTCYLQSVVLSKLVSEDRPFLLNTPYTPNPQEFQIKLPFNQDFYSTLYRSKTDGLTYSQLAELYSQIPDVKPDFNVFLSYFSNKKPTVSYNNPNLAHRDSIKISYFGHACILIESSDCNILVDPIINYKIREDSKTLTYNDLPEKIDYLLITHAHQDHVLIEHLLQIRHKVRTVIVPKSNGGFLQDPSLKLFFLEIGFSNVLEIEDMETIQIPNGYITGIPFFGEHGDLNIQTKKAHLINLYEKKILCAADSNNICHELYEKVHEIIGNIDIIFIGMECEGAPTSWVYGTLFPKPLDRRFDQVRRLNGSDCERALKIISLFNPTQVYVYAMALEPWLNYVLNINYDEDSIQLIESRKLIEKCKAQGIYAERLYENKTILIKGEFYE